MTKGAVVRVHVDGHEHYAGQHAGGAGIALEPERGMRLTIVLFGPPARAAGTSQLHIVVPIGTPTCADLREAMVRQSPHLSQVLAACRIAVNHKFVPEETLLREQDEIALIGMVSGG